MFSHLLFNTFIALDVGLSTMLDDFNLNRAHNWPTAGSNYISGPNFELHTRSLSGPAGDIATAPYVSHLFASTANISR